MRPSFHWFAFLALILLIACDEQTVKPTLPELRAEKMTYHFGGGHSYRILQYDAKGKIQGLVSGITYDDEGTFETTHEFKYEGDVLKEIHSHDLSYWSFQYVYGKNGKLSETKIYIDNELKEYHAYSYDTEGLLTSDISWSNTDRDGKFGPASQQQYSYDNRHNLVEKRQFNARRRKL